MRIWVISAVCVALWAMPYHGLQHCVDYAAESRSHDMDERHLARNDHTDASHGHRHAAPGCWHAPHQHGDHDHGRPLTPGEHEREHYCAAAQPYVSTGSGNSAWLTQLTVTWFTMDSDSCVGSPRLVAVTEATVRAGPDSASSQNRAFLGVWRI